MLPNAGLPQVVDGRAHFPLSPDEFARWLSEFVEVDGVSIVGGCCGTTPAHIRAVADAVCDLKPKPRRPQTEPATASLYQSVPMRQETSFLIIGERCNTNGSRKFKRLLSAGDVDGMLEMANEQIAEGAHVLDVCVDYVGRDGVQDMTLVADRFASDLTAPLMFDSTEIDVLEAGLKLAGGQVHRQLGQSRGWRREADSHLSPAASIRSRGRRADHRRGSGTGNGQDRRA